MGLTDLHMHSVISLDGEYRPAELARLCKKSGIETAALTDHNSVRGVKEMEEEGGRLGIRVVRGIELDCCCEGLNLHILGYGIDIDDKRFVLNEQELLKQKQEISSETIKLLLNMGIRFRVERAMELSRDGIVVGEMIAEAALEEPENMENPLMRPYFPGGSRSDNPYVNFFWDFCSQGKPAFLPVSYMTAAQAISLIQDTGGTAVIAHPGVTVKRDEDKIEKLVMMGVAGIEVYSSYHSADDRRYYGEIARRYGLFQTMGSDFHGKTKPGVKVGSGCNMAV